MIDRSGGFVGPAPDDGAIDGGGPAAGARPAGAGWPLAPNQVGVHLADALVERPGLHTVVAAYRLTGTFDGGLLAERFRALVRRHPALSSRLVDDGPALGMARSDTAPEWRDEILPPSAADDDGAARRLAECLRPIDTRNGPLMRGALMRRQDGSADLVLTASHLVVDDQAMETAVAEVLTGDTTRPPGDYPGWVTAAAGAARRGAGRAAARRAELSALPLGSAAGWGCGDGDAADADGGQLPFTVPEDVWRELAGTARGLGISRYSALTAATGLVLARNGGTDASLVGSFVTRRPAAQRHTIGYFSNTVPVPVRLAEDGTVAGYLRTCHRQCLAAYRDADLPLFDVLPTGHPSGAGPLTAAVAPLWTPPPLRLPGLTARPLPHPFAGAAKFPLLVYVDLAAEGAARGLLQFRHRWFSTDQAALFTRQLVAVLREFAERPEARLASVTVLDEADRQRVLDAGRGAPLAPEERSVPALFTRRAGLSPDRIAVNDGRTALRYAEVEERSSTVARALAEAGVRAGDRVGVRMERSCDLIVALLGVLKTGAAYVPLDPSYPEARLALVIGDADVRVVVGDADSRPADLPEHIDWLPVHTRPRDPARPLPAVDPDLPCYAIHTSGSTGRPKGVLVTHRNVTSLLNATRDGFGLGPDDVWSLFHSFAFDFSAWEIWVCLLTGGRLVVVPRAVSRNPEEFHQLLEDEEVTVLSQTPTAFGLLLATDRLARGRLSVRLVVFGGEPLDTRTLSSWFARYPRVRVENMYGITETTVHSTTHTVTPEDARTGSRVVGRPLPGWELYVLDARGRPVAPGVAGELHVGGAGVALGYLDRPELTAERFTADRHPRVPGGRLYRSGDQGRLLPGGELEHLGRLDDQVKVRGFRIELGEVRDVLLRDPSVTSAAVVVHGAGTAEARLDAYVVLTAGGSTDGLLRRAAARLPEYMVPQTVTALTTLPVTANGKLDTALLPAPEPDADAPAGPAGSPDASGDVLDRVVGAWRDVLDVPVAPDDNFFDLGGTSLLALRLKTALRGAGLPELALKEVIRHATPAAMTALLRVRAGTRPENTG
ncbi:non-ribosomal peptide synthetase [Streptomyces incarnatus]